MQRKGMESFGKKGRSNAIHSPMPPYQPLPRKGLTDDRYPKMGFGPWRHVMTVAFV